MRQICRVAKLRRDERKMILSDGTCVSKGRRTRTRKIKGNCGTNASFKSFISIEMQLWLPLSFASLLTIALGLTALLRTLPGTTCASEAGITQTRRILASCGTSTTTTGLHSFQNLDSNQKKVQMCDLILNQGPSSFARPTCHKFWHCPCNCYHDTL